MTRSATDCAGVAGLLQPLQGQLIHFEPFVTRPQPLPAVEAAGLVAAAADVGATLAFTSPRSVAAMRETAAELLTLWRQRLVFAVGPGTAAALQAAGFSHIDAAAGDSADLAARLRLLGREHNIKTVWHLGGSVTVADLGDSLQGSGIAVARVVVYHADLVPLPDDIHRQIMTGTITDVVLLSERVTEHLAPALLAAAHPPRLYCLSERIAAAARRVLSPASAMVYVAPQPLLSALVPLLAAPPVPYSGKD